MSLLDETTSLETEPAKPGFRKLPREGSGCPVTMRSVSRVFFQGDIHSDCLGRTVSI